MKKTSGKDKLKWIQTKAFYGVMLSLILAIVGIASAIYNVAKVRNLIPQAGENEPGTFYSVPDTSEESTQPQANANITNVPDERDQTKTTLNDLNRPYSGYFLLPLNSNVSKDFSDGEMIYSETMNDWRSHNGIDIKGNIGDNAIAVQDGTVLEVVNDEIWGDTVVIQHGNGLNAKYCGVKATVKPEEKIEQGQVIGTVVAIPAEEKDGVHIHLETEVDGKLVDPIKALNLLGEPIENTNE
ncbi:MAG: M23 family metallopeptidase [Clostridia bacterium]|nr:M23 family metallopeptidase [Clostridia bacterium]